MCAWHSIFVSRVFVTKFKRITQSWLHVIQNYMSSVREHFLKLRYSRSLTIIHANHVGKNESIIIFLLHVRLIKIKLNSNGFCLTYFVRQIRLRCCTKKGVRDRAQKEIIPKWLCVNVIEKSFTHTSLL